MTDEPKPENEQPPAGGLPDPARCQVSRKCDGAMFECLVAESSGCLHAAAFERLTFCLHPQALGFLKLI